MPWPSPATPTLRSKKWDWRRATFKEYVRNELACFSSGMSRDMKTKFGFVNVSGNAFSDITDACINANYFAPSTVAVM